MRLKPLKKHDGYLISDNGDIYSCWVNKGIHGLVKEDTYRKLTGSKARSGHIYFRAQRGEGATLVHRLVYETFVGEIPEGMVIRHLNDEPGDNRLSNLAIGTQKENVQDAIRNGKIKYGEGNKNSKLTDDDVRDIRIVKNDNPEVPNREIAEEFGVSRRTVDRVIKREAWGHVK